MKLPWSKEEELEKLREELEDLEEEKKRIQKRFEAEQERRSKLAREKQEAEQKINRLEDRIHGLKEEEKEEEDETGSSNAEDIEFDRAYRTLQKLQTIESPEKDMVTVYSPSKIAEVEDLKGLKNTLVKEQLELLQQHESFAAFLDQDVFEVILKTRPLFGAEWSLSDSFSPDRLIEFIESGKTWVLVSAGETRIFEERAGEYEELDPVKSRVDRKHSKGGFSQDRFERKRDEQIQKHLEDVEDALQDRENIYLLGQKEMCKELPGKYLGGFDPNSSPPEVFYSFQVIR